eukprot:3198031-Prymnesium_polylepis.1
MFTRFVSSCADKKAVACAYVVRAPAHLQLNQTSEALISTACVCDGDRVKLTLLDLELTIKASSLMKRRKRSRYSAVDETAARPREAVEVSAPHERAVSLHPSFVR